MSSFASGRFLHELDSLFAATPSSGMIAIQYEGAEPHVVSSVQEACEKPPSPPLN